MTNNKQLTKASKASKASREVSHEASEVSPLRKDSKENLETSSTSPSLLQEKYPKDKQLLIGFHHEARILSHLNSNYFPNAQRLEAKPTIANPHPYDISIGPVTIEVKADLLSAKTNNVAFEERAMKENDCDFTIYYVKKTNTVYYFGPHIYNSIYKHRYDGYYSYIYHMGNRLADGSPNPGWLCPIDKFEELPFRISLQEFIDGVNKLIEARQPSTT